MKTEGIASKLHQELLDKDFAKGFLVEIFKECETDGLFSALLIGATDVLEAYHKRVSELERELAEIYKLRSSEYMR